MIVLDASAVVEFFTRSSLGAVVGELLSSERTLVVPAHFDLEVYSGVRDVVRRRLANAQALDRVVQALPRLRAERADVVPLLPQIHELGARISPYDAPYVVLARGLDIELVTSDGRLARAAADLARVRLIRPPSPAP